MDHEDKPFGRMPDNAFNLLNTQIPPQLRTLADVISDEGFQLRIVGGAVRDALMGKTPKDIDLGTDGTPEEILKVLETNDYRVIPTGLQHGTVTAVAGGVNYEITSLRIDRACDGRHAVVDFTRNWRIDAERRDLTVNAMSCTLEGDLYDYFNGYEDLKNRRCLFVGNAEKRIREDYLRILRYFRFHARIVPDPTLPGSHDEATLKALRENRHGLNRISGERIWQEMGKILTGPAAPAELRVMYDLELMKEIGLDQDTSVHMDHFCRMHARSHDAIACLCSLLNSPEDIEKMKKRWKFSNSEERMGMFLVTQRNKDYSLKACKDFLVDKTPLDFVVQWTHIKDAPEADIDILKQWPIPTFPVNGGTLKKLGAKPGPSMGEMLADLKQEWKDSDFSMDQAALEERAKERISAQQES
eukprot:Clim_evm10s41 gene=Clim_evmTU10s41